MDGFRRLVAIFCLIILDLMALVTSLSISVYLRNNVLPQIFPFLPENPFPLRHFLSLWWFFGVYIFFFAYRGLYTNRMVFWEEVQNLTYACFLSIIGLLTIVSLGKLSYLVSRIVLLLSFLNMLWLATLFRYYGKRLMNLFGIWKKKVLILGAGKSGQMLLRALEKEKILGYEVLGFLDDDPERSGKDIGGKRVLGRLDEVDKFLSNFKVKDIFLATTKENPIVHKLQLKTENLYFIPNFIPFLNSHFKFFFDEKLLTINLRNNLQLRSNQLIKRGFDLIVVLAILIFGLPFLMLISLLIKLESRGKVFFVQKRWGKNGSIFECIKFRTMFADGDARLRDYLNKNKKANEEWKKFRKLKTFDPRITKVGNFLRRFSLDELPQIFNVIKGEMSLVGPRPYLLEEREKMGKDFDLILKTPPGITGLWQVSGRNELSFKERLALDIWYVRNWSLWLDIIILLKTFKAVITAKGAY